MWITFKVDGLYKTRTGDIRRIIYIGADFMVSANKDGKTNHSLRKLDGSTYSDSDRGLDLVEEYVPIVSQWRNIYESSIANGWYNQRQTPAQSDRHIGTLRRDKQGDKIVGYEFFPAGLE